MRGSGVAVSGGGIKMLASASIVWQRVCNDYHGNLPQHHSCHTIIA